VRVKCISNNSAYITLALANEFTTTIVLFTTLLVLTKYIHKYYSVHLRKDHEGLRRMKIVWNEYQDWKRFSLKRVTSRPESWRVNTKAPKNENCVYLIRLHENGQTSDAWIGSTSNYNTSFRLKVLRKSTLYPIFEPRTSQKQAKYCHAFKWP
jgi:hypothetical protein